MGSKRLDKVSWKHPHFIKSWDERYQSPSFLIVHLCFLGLLSFFQILADTRTLVRKRNPMVTSLKFDSHLGGRVCFICLNESPLQMMKNAFYFILKALFVLKIFKFFSWFFGQKWRDWKIGQFQNLWLHNLIKKQYIYNPISLEVRATKQWSFVSQYNMTRVIFKSQWSAA